MPLTNPNKVVTEERLSEFYGQILPYMGGMPDVLANKFSKGDLYSTDEKMIGVWTDGKPLYQKVVPFYTNGSVASGWSSSGNKWYHSDFPANYIDLLVDVAILTKDSDGNSNYGTLYKDSRFDFTWYSGGYFTLNFTTNYNNWFIMCYTKTTDSPIAIGSDTDYSTDEKIVGTWIDGRPLYQKTFELTNITEWSAISLGLANIDMITKKDSSYGILSNGDLIGEHGFFDSTSSKSYFTVMVYKTSNNQPNVYITESATGSLTKVVITVLYTKTTD